MSAVQYPFIDIAVHERIRDRFAAGEAVVLFSTDMKNALWANGRGANLFGFGFVYDFLDQGPNPADIAFRQLEAAARQLGDTGDTRNFTIRIASGFQRIAVSAACERVQIQGEAAVLFSAPMAKGQLSPAASAEGMISGFDDPDTHMAVIDAEGAVLAASAEFENLGVTTQTTGMLATVAGNDPSRLAKRPIPTVKGYLPAAVGKLSDAPALYLLFTVETAQGRSVLENGFEPKDETTSADAYADAIAAVSEIEENEEPEEEISLETGPAADMGMGLIAGDEQPAAQEPAADVLPAPDVARDAQDAAILEQPALARAVPDVSKMEEIVPEPAGFVFRRDSRATRFVWKIDSEGRFSEVSSEFADAVGPHAADINGMAFTDLAALFHLDPEGKIAELLGKRDTWSGRTIWWPVEGTSLMVPVDLAALPTYTRTREFDGFRGFGIVRIADVAEDPTAVGLTLGRTAIEDVTEPDAEHSPAPENSPEQALEQDDEHIQAVETELAVLEEPAPDRGGDHESADEAHAADDIIAEVPSAEHQPAADETHRNGQENDEPDAAEDTDVQVPSESSDAIQAADAAQDDPGVQVSGRQVPSLLEAPSLLDWPAGERPALRIVENPGRRHSDKVIKLDEHRNGRRDGLTPVEQAAFREIARQLDTVVGKSQEKAAPAEPEAAPPETEEPGEALPAAIVDTQARLGSEQAAGTDEEISGADILANETDEASLEGPDLPAQDGAEEAAEEIEPVPAEPADPHPELSDRELLSQMIPVRERIDLSAEIIDQMPVALLVHSGDLLIHGNPEFMRLTGYASIDDLAEVGGLDALLQRQDLIGKTTEAGGMVVVREDDAIVPVTARLQTVRWDGSTVLMLALMPVSSESPSSAPAEDAAEVIPLRPLRSADQLQRLQVEVEEMRAILETATDGVVILGAEGNIRSINRAASALFNYDNEEIDGKPFVTLFAHESQRAILDYLGGLSGHGVASVLNDGREVIGREASGGFLPLFMTIGKLTSSNGYCAVIRDITQWKRTEDELRTAKRAAETANAHKSDFLAHVSHEIRTPLNAIIGFADMMATERLGPIGHPRYVEYANDIGRSGRHVLDIVNDLLDISKIEAGEMDLEFVAVGLNETVSEAVSLVQPQANGQRVIIRTALSHAVPQVVADLRSIRQIVLNILSNAIRFTPSGGQIVVSTAYETNGSVVLRVRDTGIGMTRTELELAMKPFRQVGATRKRGDGTGLGLPLTKAMVDANRAAFSINSAPNEGTLVEITFPSPRVLAN